MAWASSVAKADAASDISRSVRVEQHQPARRQLRVAQRHEDQRCRRPAPFSTPIRVCSTMPRFRRAISIISAIEFVRERRVRSIMDRPIASSIGEAKRKAVIGQDDPLAGEIEELQILAAGKAAFGGATTPSGSDASVDDARTLRGTRTSKASAMSHSPSATASQACCEPATWISTVISGCACPERLERLRHQAARRAFHDGHRHGAAVQAAQVVDLGPGARQFGDCSGERDRAAARPRWSASGVGARARTAACRSRPPGP